MARAFKQLKLFLGSTSIVAIGLQPRDLVMLRGQDTAALADMPLCGLKFGFFHRTLRAKKAGVGYVSRSRPPRRLVARHAVQSEPCRGYVKPHRMSHTVIQRTLPLSRPYDRPKCAGMVGTMSGNPITEILELAGPIAELHARAIWWRNSRNSPTITRKLATSDIDSGGSLIWSISLP